MRLSFPPAALVVLMSGNVLAQEQPEAANGDEAVELPASRLCAFEQVVYNDNIFLTNGGANLAQQLGPNAARSDTIFRTGACGDSLLYLGRQVIKLSGTIEDQRFRHNRRLNHTAGKASAQWDWRTASDWYGEFGGDYQRALGSFLNDRTLEKDLVDSAQYRAHLNHDIGARLTLGLGGSRDDVHHGTTSRKGDDYANTSVDGRLTLTSRAGNYVGVMVQHDTAKFPNEILIGTTLVDRDYNEMSELLRLRYGLTSKLTFTGSAGNLERDYLQAQEPGFSGAVWRVNLQWQPADRLSVDVSQWKELSAYLDAESDHFIGRGNGINATWSPRDRWQLGAGWRWTREQYITRSVLASITGPREDKVQVGSVTSSWALGEHLRLELKMQYQLRDSTLSFYNYNNRISSLQITGEL